MGRNLTEDELISTLRHSEMPTILVEGKDDLKIFRWLEDDINALSSTHVDILPCGCRNTLLKLYKQRSTFSKVIFVADKDQYVYGTIPPEYSDVVFTTGYSIENDLYQGKGIENLFDKQDRAIFNKALDSYLEYYAREVEKCIKGEEFKLTQSPQEILKCYLLKDEYKPQQPPQQSMVLKLKENYDLLLRGHSLFQLLLMVLTRKERLSKPNMDSIYEMCYKSYKSECILNLRNTVLSLLS